MCKHTCVCIHICIYAYVCMCMHVYIYNLSSPNILNTDFLSFLLVIELMHTIWGKAFFNLLLHYICSQHVSIKNVKHLKISTLAGSKHISASPVLFNIVVHEVDEDPKGRPIKLADVTKLKEDKLRWMTDTAFRKHCDRRGKWKGSNKMKYNMDKHQVLHFQTTNHTRHNRA